MPVNKQNLNRAVHAALQGPEARDLRIAKYRFNVKPARVERENGAIVVIGNEDRYISRRRRARPNDRIYYEFEKNASGIHNLGIDINRGGLRPSNIARALGDVIRQLPLPPDPGPTIPPDDRGPWFRLASLPSDEAIPDELLHLLDGSWEAEAEFLVANIALRAR